MGSGPKAAQGLEDNENRHDKQQAGFDQRRDRFDLSMPVVVPFIGGLSADANRERGSCRGVRRLAAHARLLLGRRWPSGIPSTRAFCLRAPGVRLSALEMVLTGVLSLECCLSSFTSARVQSRRTMLFLVAIVLAISFSFFFTGSDSTTFGHKCISLRESAAFMGRDMSAMS